MARITLSAVLVLASLAGAAPVVAAPNLPPLPGSPGGTPSSGSNGASGTTGSDAAAGSAATVETLRRGIVQVEQGGRPLAVGTVLSRDGRVLTSLSGLGNVAEPDIRYADGTVVKTKIGHKDKTWDLALLIPQTGKWVDGLVPTDTDPGSVDLKTFLPKGGKLGASGVGYKGRIDAKSKEGEALRSVLDIDFKGGLGVPGAPVLDPDGRVVGILVHACKEAAAASDKSDKGDKADKPEAKDAPKEAKDAKAPACSPLTIAAPVYALRGFLMKTPTNAVQPSAWLGLGGAPSDSGNVKGVKVMGLAPGSPAEKAGLKAGADSPDTIVAVDGQPVESPEQLAQVIAKRAIGQTVKLLVFSAGKFREVPVTLRAAP